MDAETTETDQISTNPSHAFMRDGAFKTGRFPKLDDYAITAAHFTR